ncbi:MAG: 50S ribosomal protein L19 [Planctomycetes bacterium ADurb.Bin069]|nr:MAG: 50S ribosomal protein L19 [Planctomycetes bacterium ADurb.Bin069]
MTKLLISDLEKELVRAKKFDFDVGDVVDVHCMIREGDKERVQIFSGTVIARKRGAVREAFTVRRIVSGEGVERVFPMNSPRLVDVRVKRRGRVRRAKLYYLRDRVGKAVKVKESRVGPKAAAAARQPETKADLLHGEE